MLDGHEQPSGVLIFQLRSLQTASASRYRRHLAKNVSHREYALLTMASQIKGRTNNTTVNNKPAVLCGQGQYMPPGQFYPALTFSLQHVRHPHMKHVGNRMSLGVNRQPQLP